MKKKITKNLEWSILICTILLVIIGLFAIYSATESTNQEEFRKQLTWIGVSIPFLIIFTLLDYDTISKISPFFYVLAIASLVAVLFTEPISGATSWFTFGSFSIQPSEFTKIIVILLLGLIMSKMKKKGPKEISRPTRLFLLLIIFAIPVALIVKQPDYGTAIAFIVSFLFMLFVAGIDKRYIIVSVLLVAIAVPLLYKFVLPEHAKKRIDVFLNPELDPRGSGYNLTQSKIAIGAGELLGMGLLKGNQTQLGFLYPKSTDFIFSVIGEELGFIVAGAVVILYVVLITKALYVSKTAKDDLGTIISAGIAGIFFFHMVENIGMTMGLLPITGVPLPFVSYGGSSLLSNFIMIAILLNISGRRQKAIFIEQEGRRILVKNKIKIGNLELNNNVILGPMAGLTDRAFRIICEKFNPGLVVTEMISSRALFHNDEKTKKLLDTSGEKRPIAVQIFGSDTESMSYAAKYINDNYQIDIIDINMGCPAPKIVKNGDGSRLLLDMEKVYKITKVVVSSSRVPVTVKIRKGWDNEHITALEASKMIEEAGASAITVHGRTRAEYYSGTADWNIIRQVKENVSIPVIGNGDIKTVYDAEKIINQTNCDGIMISRASLGNPWIFEHVQNYLKGKNIREISKEEILNIILEHINLEVQEKGEYIGIREMRKHICYYLKNMKNASQLRNEINHLETKQEVEDILKAYFLNNEI